MMIDTKEIRTHYRGLDLMPFIEHDILKLCDHIDAQRERIEIAVKLACEILTPEKCRKICEVLRGEPGAENGTGAQKTGAGHGGE